MKIIIVHNSSCEKGYWVADEISKSLGDNNIIANHISNAPPEFIIEHNPDCLILGIELCKPMQFMKTLRLKRWLSRLKRTLDNQNKILLFGACYITTHITQYDKISFKAGKCYSRVMRFCIFKNLYPQWFPLRIELKTPQLSYGLKESIIAMTHEILYWMDDLHAEKLKERVW